MKNEENIPAVIDEQGRRGGRARGLAQSADVDLLDLIQSLTNIERNRERED